jgi:hypothetical protein
MMGHFHEKKIVQERRSGERGHSCGKGAAKAGGYGTVTIIGGWRLKGWFPLKRRR